MNVDIPSSDKQPVKSGNSGYVSSGTFGRSKGLKEWVPVNYNF